MLMLDFDKMKKMTFDEKGIEQAVRSIELNGSYFPKPRDDMDDGSRGFQLLDAFQENVSGYLGADHRSL